MDQNRKIAIIEIFYHMSQIIIPIFNPWLILRILVFEACLKLKLINLKSLSFTEYNTTAILEIFILISKKSRFYLLQKEY